MTNSRSMALRIAGLAGIGCALLLILQMLAIRISGANVYSDNFESTLIQIDSHRLAFTLSGVTGALAAGCLLPMILGLASTLDDRDRHMTILAGGFFFLSAVLLLDAYAHYGNLVGTALDYTHQVAPRDVLVEDGDIIGDQFEILQYAGMVSLGLGGLVATWLISRSTFYQKPAAWLTFAMACSSFVFVLVPAPLILSRITWAMIMGGNFFWASFTTLGEEAEPAIV